VHPPWKTVWRFLRKLKIELPHDPVIQLLGISPDKSIIQKYTCTCMFIAQLFMIAKAGDNLTYIHSSVNEGIEKM